MMRLELARMTRADLLDYARCVGVDVPDGIEPIGYAARDGGAIVGVGAVFQIGGRWWGIVDAPKLHGCAMALHRAARRLLDDCRNHNRTIHVLRDGALNTSARWLSRLGFRPTGEMVNDREVWVCPA